MASQAQDPSDLLFEHRCPVESTRGSRLDGQVFHLESFRFAEVAVKREREPVAQLMASMYVGCLRVWSHIS